MTECYGNPPADLTPDQQDAFEAGFVRCLNEQDLLDLNEQDLLEMRAYYRHAARESFAWAQAQVERDYLHEQA